VPTSSSQPTTPGTGIPTNLRASSTSNNVTLTWTGPANTTYDILRGEDGVKIASVQGNTFTDAGLNANTPYVYSVRGPGGTTPQLTVVPGSSPTTAVTPPPVGSTSTPVTAPPASGAPTNLRKTGQTASTITLSWDGPAGGSYDILRGEAGDKIATVTGNTFTDIGLLANTPYVYSVRGGGVTTPQITLTIGGTALSAAHVR
jgi:chitodextrinase